MNAPRRRVLRSVGATAGLASIVATAGCQTLTQDAHLLVVENETDSARSVTITVRRAPEGTETTTTDATTTPGTSQRFVVDFQYDVPAGSTRENSNVLPEDGTYEVLAALDDDDATARGFYTDTESVRVTITDDGVTVDTFAPQ
ncbi:hypothetical protein G9C85_12060 [Halorubellus sp. JP-L1]|uniref:hypothetical protein n=1 Tax=Halorubellus sp. JP-L1 TaxID=2715753 RepID=UPI00140E46D4|nr:hypothetical protein [Halorubellus sp. JP-L1]NHN42355.1 hypothetical protein [Halorubellus sp. JP-L1]